MSARGRLCVKARKIFLLTHKRRARPPGALFAFFALLSIENPNVQRLCRHGHGTQQYKFTAQTSPAKHLSGHLAHTPARPAPCPHYHQVSRQASRHGMATQNRPAQKVDLSIRSGLLPCTPNFSTPAGTTLFSNYLYKIQNQPLRIHPRKAVSTEWAKTEKSWATTWLSPTVPKKVLFSAQRLRYSQSFRHVLCVLEQSNL